MNIFIKSDIPRWNEKERSYIRQYHSHRFSWYAVNDIQAVSDELFKEYYARFKSIGTHTYKNVFEYICNLEKVRRNL